MGSIKECEDGAALTHLFTGMVIIISIIESMAYEEAHWFPNISESKTVVE